MTRGKIESIIANLITVVADGPVAQNEICMVITPNNRFRAEVIRVNGDHAFAQVFEATQGIRVGYEVEFTGHMLEVELGPGILSKNYDGLQNDLDKMQGVFLSNGEVTNPLDEDTLYAFEPLLKPGDEVTAGDWIGSVKENWIDHKIMAPFTLSGTYAVRKIVDKGDFRINDELAVLSDEEGAEVPVTMIQRWPVKRGIPVYQQKMRPEKILQTGLRVIDTLNPLAEGGTGFIPGPFGTGKTVLQQAIAKNSEADIIFIVACGERANEVVDIFTEFPELEDPRTGRKLQERTTIICNTSNMPVAAREASVYVGMTLAEYYRNMGLKVLLLADSTSRWAQALREMSNRLEELPGPDAFPVELPATIANFYSRAGFVELNNGRSGSVTFVGTVSPAGGNFKEPVTESTGKVARCFYALSQKRADAKRYPAIDPLASYSKYLEYDEFIRYADEHIRENWVTLVGEIKKFIRLGLEAREQINILGDDAVPVEYHVRFWISEVIDFGFIQQDSFDPVDMNTSIERQKYMLDLLIGICRQEYDFDDFQLVADHFKKVINLLKQMNYSDFESEDFSEYEQELKELLDKKQKVS